jgi:hypothetical protein
MRMFKSIIGALLASLYALAFAAAYVDYLNKTGGWFADLWLVLIALPFTLTMRFLAGGVYGFTGADTGKVALAALFCCALAWIVGAVLEKIIRVAFGAIRRAVRGRASGSKPQH